VGRPRHSDCTHPTLSLHRHFHRWKDEPPEKSEATSRPCKILATRFNAWYAKEGDPLLNALAIRRKAEREALCVSWPETAIIHAKTVSQLYVGSSVGRLFDIGLTLHPIYGVPYIPASGIRGAVQHWAGEAGYEGVTDWFGSEREQSPVWIGDAFPLPGFKVREGILTKHHASYYEGAEPGPPADWEVPAPVAFLTVKAGAEFEFVVGARPPEGERPGASLTDVEQLVAETLAFAGLGAKTRKGYGLFEIVSR